MKPKKGEQPAEKPVKLKKDGTPAKRRGPAPGTPRPRRNHVVEQEHRDKIETTRILNKLQNHILKKSPLSATQLQAAKILLAKTIPDLKNIEHAGNVNMSVSKIVEEIVQPGAADGN